MTPETLKAWRGRMRWSKAAAARELGIGPNRYSHYEAGTSPTGCDVARPIPKTIALACAAITHRLDPEE